MHQLKRDITLTSQGNLSITEYFTKLKTLWDELGAYLVLPNCNCTKDFDLSRFVEGERIHPFLMGLDIEQFGTVRSNLLATEPLPTLNKAYAIVPRDERQQLLMKGMENKAVVEALAFRAAATNKSKQPSRPKCTHCQRVGHEWSQRFEIICYSPNWQGRQTNQGEQSGSRSGSRVFTDGVRDGWSKEASLKACMTVEATQGRPVFKQRVQQIKRLLRGSLWQGQHATLTGTRKRKLLG